MLHEFILLKTILTLHNNVNIEIVVIFSSSVRYIPIEISQAFGLFFPKLVFPIFYSSLAQ